MLKDDITSFEADHHGVFLGFSKLQKATNENQSPLLSIWEDKIRVAETWVDTYQSHEQNVTTTFWDLGNEFLAASREMMSNAATITKNGTIPLSNHRDWFYVIQNGPYSLYSAYVDLLDAQANATFKKGDILMNLLLALIIVEACVLSIATIAYLLHLSQRVSMYRSKVYSIFIMIPNNLLRSLASKKVSASEIYHFLDSKLVLNMKICSVLCLIFLSDKCGRNGG